jgi:ABC-type Zn uptake system ZnuABC Zn-binding protein ZnuA
MERVRRILALLVFGTLTVLVVGCGGAESGGAAHNSGERVRVATTISVIGSMVEEVAGERAEVFSIVPAGADVHTFQPSPSDALKISESEVVFQNGLGLEEWLDGLVESAGGENTKVVELSEGLEPLAEGEHGNEHGVEEDHHTEEHGAEEEGGHAHEHVEGNPHLWLDVENAEHYVERIRDTLIEVDPEGAEEYRANSEEYLNRLEELDGYIEEQAGSIPEENRKLITFHDAFPYFAEAYGFELIDVILQNPEAEPSSREMAELVREIEEQNVPAVFTEPQFNQELANTIAQEADVEVYELYSDALVDDPAADSYEVMMRTNINRVVEGLR